MKKKNTPLLNKKLSAIIIFALVIMSYQFSFAQLRIMPLGDFITRGEGPAPAVVRIPRRFVHIVK